MDNTILLDICNILDKWGINSDPGYGLPQDLENLVEKCINTARIDEARHINEDIEKGYLIVGEALMPGYEQELKKHLAKLEERNDKGQ